MYISCCAPACQYQMVSEAGFDRIVLSAQEVAGAPPDLLQTLSHWFHHRNLTCWALNDFCPPELKLCGPNYSPGQVERYVERLAPKAAQLGVAQIGIGAPLSRRIPENFSRQLAQAQLLESLELTARLCRPYNIQILLEPVCRQMTNFLNGTSEVLALADRCDAPVDIVYDIFHAWMMEEPPAAARPAIDRIGIVHIAHAHNGRRLPTTETITQYHPYLQMLLDSGYQGEISIEAQMDGIDQSRLAQSCQALRQALTSAAAASRL